MRTRLDIDFENLRYFIASQEKIRVYQYQLTPSGKEFTIYSCYCVVRNSNPPNTKRKKKINMQTLRNKLRKV